MKNKFALSKLNKKLFLAAILLVIAGIFISLSIEAIRYTKFIEPKTVEIDPKVAYNEMLQHPDEYLFFDVRSLGEYQNIHASSSVSMPIANLYDNWRTLPRSGKTIYLICSSGRLAAIAYGYLQLHGFRNIVHINGGIQNWANEGVPTITKPIFTNINAPLDKSVEINN
ncbi:MAG: Rhodanese domain protein [Candidatus Nomurabacteria bacterium]|nr:Rhodanese domain protein [Candidatus Nomurabacteria bacterium]